MVAQLERIQESVGGCVLGVHHTGGERKIMDEINRLLIEGQAKPSYGNPRRPGGVLPTARHGPQRASGRGRRGVAVAVRDVVTGVGAAAQRWALNQRWAAMVDPPTVSTGETVAAHG